MESNITADIKFAILPEWVLAADVSDRAVRMYAILARYADNDTLQAFPSRETLAKRARCNAKAVTKAVNELVAIGAVTKQHRKNGDAYQSNIYTLRRVGPDLTIGRVTGDTGVGSDLTPGRVSDDLLTITTELEPQELEPLNNIFDDFWKIYPKKADKALAKRSLEKALKRATAERILDGARQYRDDPGRDDAYTKNPSTWLNADAWENEYVKPKETPGPGKREWVREMHMMGEHWACEPSEFAEGCDQ
jgi:hypothetical protein